MMVQMWNMVFNYCGAVCLVVDNICVKSSFDSQGTIILKNVG